MKDITQHCFSDSNIFVAAGLTSNFYKMYIMSFANIKVVKKPYQVFQKILSEYGN